MWRFSTNVDYSWRKSHLYCIEEVLSKGTSCLNEDELHLNKSPWMHRGMRYNRPHRDRAGHWISVCLSLLLGMHCLQSDSNLSNLLIDWLILCSRILNHFISVIGQEGSHPGLHSISKDFPPPFCPCSPPEVGRFKGINPIRSVTFMSVIKSVQEFMM